MLTKQNTLRGSIKSPSTTQFILQRKYYFIKSKIDFKGTVQ
jgi:hypothetical protein